MIMVYAIFIDFNSKYNSLKLPRTFKKYFIGLCHRKWKTMYYNPWASMSTKLFVSCCRSSDMYNNFWARVHDNLWTGKKTSRVECGINCTWPLGYVGYWDENIFFISGLPNFLWTTMFSIFSATMQICNGARMYNCEWAGM